MSGRVVTVHLHGALGDEFGRQYRLFVRSPAEAVRLLEANFPGRFYRYVREKFYHVVKGPAPERGIGLGETMLNAGTDGQDIHIIPAVQGASSKGMWQTIAGVVLIGAAFVLSGGLAAPTIAAGFAAMSGTLYGVAMNIGIALALGGVASLLSQTPKSSLGEDKNDDTARMFGGPVNVTEQGVCLPVIYGRVIVGSIVDSAGIHVDSVTLQRTIHHGTFGPIDITDLVGAG